MTAHRRHPLFVSCLSLVLLAACGKKDAIEGKPKDAAAPAAAKAGDAEAGDAKAGDAEAGDTKAADPTAVAAITAEGPKGKDAADNHKPLVDALAGLEGCKLNEDATDIDGDCAAYDTLAKVVGEAEDKDLEAVGRTLVNLLSDASDTVRWTAQSQLSYISSWVEHDAWIATVLVALASENNKDIAYGLASELGNIDDERMLGDKLRPTLESTLVALTHREAFDNLLPSAMDCGSNDKCTAVLLSAAQKNPELANRAYAAQELMDSEKLLDNSCAVATEVAVALAKAPAPAEDSEDDFHPHERASSLISSVRSVSIEDGDKTQDCAAVLPGLIDEVTALAKAGTLVEDTFVSVLEIDAREDKNKYMDKLQALAEAVKGNAKLSDDMKQTATDALEGWKADEAAGG